MNILIVLLFHPLKEGRDQTSPKVISIFNIDYKNIKWDFFHVEILV